MYKSLIRPLFFRLSPEKAHHFTFSLIKNIHKIPGVAAVNRMLFMPSKANEEVELFGLKFPNRIGLAAGFDKDGKLFEELANYGFGFIEVGTVTPKAQAGNPQPRLFRLPADGALINRMGFNNEGVEALVTRLRKRKNHRVIIGGNIGKNKFTANENALDDYRICLQALHPHVDYFVVNVSSPNTPNLRELQEKEPLKALLSALKEDNASFPKPRPILLKIAPDLTDSQLDDIIEIVEETKIDGLIATNTTISRAGLNTDAATIEAIGMGGLSGKPVRARSTEVIKYLSTKSQGRIPIIAVGGISTAADYREKIEAGASLVQVYTGFIYEGPGMVKKLLA
ncbi:MAG: dihydroorotate dehydrogenase (quinone) [Bacteroidetes bacterium]|nr:MAG: dihydroorotate dehydrogenase (quinone) [Bacteroidota bacterium]